MIMRIIASVPVKRLMWCLLVLVCIAAIKTFKQYYSNILSFQKWESWTINSHRPVLNHEQPRNASIIFIGGHQSTGTGLMRILLDVHPLVRCGPEPIITWEIMNFRKSMKAYMNKLEAAGVTSRVIDEATAGFIVSVIENMGPPAERLCHKQPGIYYYLRELGDLFHEAKFIHMIRDGRASVLSTITRKVDPQFTADKPVEAIKLWENYTRQMIDDCKYIGAKRCLAVRYECLVLEPEVQLRRILRFLNLRWDPALLKHEKVMNKTSKVSFMEASTVQLIKPIHIKSLDLWTKNNSVIPQAILRNFHNYTSLLDEMGYSSKQIPPNYKQLCKQ
uniref:Protein-tyrosine sulfotransferase n=1 Tax=Trichobilharzia regenti TaxID=157069 RepID=A0AA85K5S4_TRIRE|nr:unnamed protein product [Trichobilharzia regenti]